MGYNESYIENMDSREGFSVDEIEVYEAMADEQAESDRDGGYPCRTCGACCDEEFCNEQCESEFYAGDDDGQPSEYQEWQDVYGGDDNPADWVYDDDRDFGMDG